MSMRRLLPILGLALSFATPVQAAERPYILPGATEQVVASPEGEAYRVMVARPDQPPPDGGYPVLYVLDGEDNFPIAVATARRLIRAGARSGVDPGIVIGIDSGDLARRARDYTPAIQGDVARPGQPGHGLPTGGADAFLRFLTTRVHSAATAGLPVNPDRIAIAGHSFGGLFVLHALRTQPRFFSTYIAASPSLWVGDGQLLRDARLAPQDSAPRLLLLNLGEQEGAQGSVGDSAWQNAERLRAVLSEHGVTVRLRQLSGESHGSTMPPTLTDAVRAAFSAKR